MFGHGASLLLIQSTAYRKLIVSSVGCRD